MDRCLYMEIFTIKERVSFDFMLRDSIDFMLNMKILVYFLIYFVLKINHIVKILKTSIVIG